MDILHPDRGGTAGTVPKLGVVVHDSEGGENSANLISYLGSPGDRPLAGGGAYGGGYNAVATEAGSYTEVAGGGRNPYHAPPLNATFWSICIPGRANQTRDQWLDAASRGYIRGVARYIVDRWNDDGHRWPLEFRSSAELVAGRYGYTSHAQVSQAWHRTDHTDPGAAFPWDVLAADIAALIVPPPDDIVVVIVDEQPDHIDQPPEEDEVTITVFQPSDCAAEFIAYTDANGWALQVEWISTADDQRRRDEYLHTPGSKVRVDRSPRTGGGFRNCGLIGPVPTGDSYNWSDADFAYRIPKTTG